MRADDSEGTESLAFLALSNSGGMLACAVRLDAAGKLPGRESGPETMRISGPKLYAAVASRK